MMTATLMTHRQSPLRKRAYIQFRLYNRPTALNFLSATGAAAFRKPVMSVEDLALPRATISETVTVVHLRPLATRK